MAPNDLSLAESAQVGNIVHSPLDWTSNRDLGLHDWHRNATKRRKQYIQSQEVKNTSYRIASLQPPPAPVAPVGQKKSLVPKKLTRLLFRKPHSLSTTNTTYYLHVCSSKCMNEVKGEQQQDASPMSFVTTSVGALTTRFTPTVNCSSVYIQVRNIVVIAWPAHNFKFDVC